MKDEAIQELEDLIAAVDQLEFDPPITYLKFRLGTSEWWILSKEKPEAKVIAGCTVKVIGEIVPGWWLWTY